MPLTATVLSAATSEQTDAPARAEEPSAEAEAPGSTASTQPDEAPAEDTSASEAGEASGEVPSEAETTEAAAETSPSSDAAALDAPLPPLPPLPPQMRPDEGEAAAAEDTATAEVAAPLPPSPPESLREEAKKALQAEADKASEEAAVPVAYADAPMPPLRPVGEALPWRLRPVVDHELAQQTAGVLRDLFANDFTSALAGQASLEDPLARTLVEYLYVRDPASHAPWERIRRFINEHPGWPSHGLIETRFEVALFSQNASTDEVIEAFTNRPPETNPGRIALAQALMAKGRRGEAKAIAAELWRRTDLTSAEERTVAEKLGDLLTKADHRARAVRLVYTGELRDAASLAGKLDDPDKSLIETVSKALRGDKKARKALDGLPKAVREEPVALFAKARLARRAGEDEEAGRILMKAPSDEDALAVPAEWWLEQKLASRWHLERGHAEKAYELTLKHAAQDPVERSDAEWQAGWIALRFLEKPDEAIRHFAEARRVVSLPISVARCEYWLGRAYEARGDNTVAHEHYEDAAAHYSTYYGQLALTRLEDGRIEQPRKPIQVYGALRWAEEQEPVKAIRLLFQVGYEDLASRMMISLARDTESNAMKIALAELANMLGLHSTTLTIGKLGLYDGAPTEYYAFTMDGLPAYPVIGTPVDPALVYAIARQESIFNPRAQSHAGARGLMQLMPATAARTARAYGQAFHESRLIQDPTYNVMIGAAHLGQLMEEYDGGYAMVFGAYNAGGGRVDEWLERFGDPRKGEVDPVDWVELIPFAETRNYVQRVMEGLQVYRARLGHEKLRIVQDLRGERGGPTSAHSYASAASGNPFGASR